MNAKWIISNAVGEGIGIALVATVYAALDRQLLSGSTLPILVAGAWEGLCLGCAQAWILRSAGIEPKRWIALTVIGAALGYGLSLLGGAGQAEAADQAEPSIGLIMMLGAALGLFMGALMGGIQSIGAGGILSRKHWILANLIGWAPAMAVIMFGASVVDRSMTLGAIALAGAASGGSAGALLGAITQTALPKMRSEVS